ncbi:hypothetical protein Phi10:1_gp100 [Cellulophaga phage phi10:1]|uniref:Uncharacterized protein n=1 Tax=Cellulophaga phage phi10:1 TaxID=1327981 RepID=S0A0V7_9CAUD|nr:hypothetical protein Phi10:1_gp100 [Cellulophaga phage phi10:1]AGO48440.1 hypothetical protein Phi10:1_gp100 [Cellulophaga phage phi10:1]
MEELQNLIAHLKNKGLTDAKIPVDVWCGIIEYFENNQETKKCNISDVIISVERAEKYARMQHFLGETGRDFIDWNDWVQN